MNRNMITTYLIVLIMVFAFFGCTPEAQERIGDMRIEGEASQPRLFYRSGGISSWKDLDFASEWRRLIQQADIRKQGLDDLNSRTYQYFLTGLGGTSVMVSPYGFAAKPAPGIRSRPAGYQPQLLYEYWWNEKGHRLAPYVLQGGYEENVDSGLITEFAQTQFMNNGLIETDLTLEVDEKSIVSNRKLFVTPEGVLVISITDRMDDEMRFYLKITTDYGWNVTGDSIEDGIILAAERDGASKAVLALVAEGDHVLYEPEKGVISAYTVNEPLTIYIAPASSYGQQEPISSARRKALKARRAGFENALNETVQWWESFYSRSMVWVPDDEVLTWFIRSLYYHGAVIGNSKIPPGCYATNPAGFYGNICLEYDLVFSHFALLYTNHLKESKNLVDWIYRILPKARENAREAVVHTTVTRHDEGAKYAWLMGYDGTIYDAPAPIEGGNLHHYFPGINAALMSLTQAEWSGDNDTLDIAKQVLYETTTVALDTLVKGSDGKYFDENRPNTVQHEAVRYALQKAEQYDLKRDTWPDINQIARYSTYHTELGRRVIWGWSPSSPDLNHVDATWLSGLWWYGTVDSGNSLVRPTYEMLKDSNTIHYVFNRGWLGVYAAQLKDGDEACRQLKRLIMPGVTQYGVAITETVRDGLDFARSPEMGAHGAFIDTLVQMLVKVDSADEIGVFPSIPAEWFARGVAFKTLRINGGIEVSASYQNNVISVHSKNLTNTRQERRIVIGVPHGAGRVEDLDTSESFEVNEDNTVSLRCRELEPGQEIHVRLRVVFENENDERTDFPVADAVKSHSIGEKAELRWMRVLGANDYKVIVDTSRQLSKPVIEILTQDNICVVSGLMSGETYYCQVYARGGDEEDTWIPISDVTSFIVVDLPKIPFTDEFQAQSLSDAWEASGTYTMQDGKLRIMVHAGAQDESCKFLLNTLELPEDFSVVTKMNYRPNANYLQGGITIWQDADHYVKFCRVYNDGNGFEFAGPGLSGGGWYDDPVHADSIYLKLERQEDTYAAFYSVDGGKWIQIGEIAYASMHDARAGIVASSWSNAEDEISFDSFHIRRR